MNKIIELDELRKIQIDILKAFATFCDENHLTYFLFGGTAIGAIRHKGYIPWDDDVDVAMPREDYEKLIKFFSVKGFELITPHNNKKYIYPFIKIVNPKTIIQERTSLKTHFGIYIDVFPIDKISTKKVNSYYRKRKIYEFIMTCKMAEKKRRSAFKNIILGFFRILFIPVKLNFLAKKIDKNAKSCFDVQNNMSGNILWGYGPREVMDEGIFAEVSNVVFENETFKIMKRYDEYLKNIYGDYMSLPPKEKRVYKHDFKAYWI